MAQPQTIWTLGHSTRSIEDFIALLRHYRIEVLADVRRCAFRAPAACRSSASRRCVTACRRRASITSC